MSTVLLERQEYKNQKRNGLVVVLVLVEKVSSTAMEFAFWPLKWR